MNWCDERYVRLYTRDTVTWLSLSLEAQGLLGIILRKVDRAGVLELGGIGKRGVAVAINHGSRWTAVEPALDELVALGVVALDGDRLVMPKFIEAQEAKQNDRTRQAESRARRRERAYTDVTPRDTQSRNVTNGHDLSQHVTACHSVPCLAVPSLTSAAPLELVPTSPPAPRFDFEALYRRYPRKRGKGAGLETCTEEIRTPGDYLELGRAIDAYALEVRGDDPKYVLHFSTFMGRWRDFVPEAAHAEPCLLDRHAEGELS